MTEKEKCLIEVYARCMEALHNFDPSPLDADACRISGPLVSTNYLALGGFEANEQAARRFVRDYARCTFEGIQSQSKDEFLSRPARFRT